MRNYDLDFLKRFSMVIAFLALVTLVLKTIVEARSPSIHHETEA